MLVYERVLVDVICNFVHHILDEETAGKMAPSILRGL